MKTVVNVPSKRNKPNKIRKKYFFIGILKVADEKSRIPRSRFESGSIHWYRSTDPDPYQNATDPQHCIRPAFTRGAKCVYGTLLGLSTDEKQKSI
jgi:hypothetical protein